MDGGGHKKREMMKDAGRLRTMSAVWYHFGRFRLVCFGPAGERRKIRAQMKKRGNSDGRHGTFCNFDAGVSEVRLVRASRRPRWAESQTLTKMRHEGQGYELHMQKLVY